MRKSLHESLRHRSQTIRPKTRSQSAPRRPAESRFVKQIKRPPRRRSEQIWSLLRLLQFGTFAQPLLIERVDEQRHHRAGGKRQRRPDVKLLDREANE